jgi:hypothetical protein
MIAILNEEDTKTVATEKGLSGEAVLRSIANILIRCTEIIKMLLNTSGKTVDDKKIIVSEFIKSQKFKQIETGVIKYISGKINDLKKELKKAEKKKQKEVSKKMDKQIKTMEKIEEAVRATPIDTSRFIFDEAGISPIPSIVFDDGENDEFEGPPPRLEPLKPPTPEASSPPPEIVPEANDIDELNTAIGKDVDLINKLVKRKETIADDDTKSQEQKSIAISAINTSIVKIQKEIDEYRRQIRAIEADTTSPPPELVPEPERKDLRQLNREYMKYKEEINDIIEGNTNYMNDIFNVMVNETIEASAKPSIIEGLKNAIQRNVTNIDELLGKSEIITREYSRLKIPFENFKIIFFRKQLKSDEFFKEKIEKYQDELSMQVENEKNIGERAKKINIGNLLDTLRIATDESITIVRQILSEEELKAIPDEMEAIIMPDGRPPAGEEKEEMGEPDAEEEDDEKPKPKPKTIPENKQIPYPEDISSKGKYVKVGETKVQRQLKDILFKKQPADLGKLKREDTRLRAIEKNNREYSNKLTENLNAIKKLLKSYGYKETDYKTRLTQIDADYPDKDESNKQQITYLFNNFLLTSTKMIVPKTGEPLFIRDKVGENKGGKRKTKDEGDDEGVEKEKKKKDKKKKDKKDKKK